MCIRLLSVVVVVVLVVLVVLCCAVQQQRVCVCVRDALAVVVVWRGMEVEFEATWMPDSWNWRGRNVEPGRERGWMISK